ncbi:unnamed protein product [Brassicogethes aeneus]|uniref:RRM domain-containing protein n=1 Tax=Brassicogethes aeneus TaxID=1431903 RepID=A0A9P0B8W8_BRAAE|nr:unnamed protein product [Brassicogethes aeneus]
MSTRVYVGNIPYDTRERDLENFFRKFGRIHEIFLKNGYAFVEFDDSRDADDAVYELNDRKLLGRRVSVEIAKGKPRPRADTRKAPPTRTDYRLIVENLSSTISWHDLKKYMGKAGEVAYADAHNIHRNEGIVEFTSYDDMKYAIEKLDNTDLNGRKIRLTEDVKAKSKRDRSRSRSPRTSRRRSHSKEKDSRSRSRSRSLSKQRDNKSPSRSRSPSVKRSRSPSRSPSKAKD